LGIIKLKTGDWDNAEYLFNKALSLRVGQESIEGAEREEFLGKEEINLAHLNLIKRNFKASKELAERFLHSEVNEGAYKLKSLAHEFLGELLIEENSLELAKKHLAESAALALTIAPESDVMTEIKRRQAQLFLLQGELKAGMDESLSCIRLCNKIGDKHELGAVLRILGEIRLRQGLPKKAVSAFEASIDILKGINECYEQMRSCVVYSEYLVDTKNDSADIYMLEAKQLCKKLGIGFFMSQIFLIQSKYEYNNGDFLSARTSVKTADELCGTVQKSDQKILKPKIREWYKTLEHTIVRVSMASAEKLKSIGKIYEEARFPIEDLKPELALEVARNVSAESLFLVQRRNAGYRVPLKFNISANDAKQVLRRQIKANANELFDGNNPKIYNMMNGKTLVSVPGQTGTGYILCTIIEEGETFTPSALEFLFASVEALERAAEEYSIPPKKIDVGDFIEEKDNWLTHPGGHFKEIITLDQEMIKIIRLAERASQTTVPILLEGETGVGKELFARALHTSSIRAKGQFVAMNAGGVPLNLLESQLFGHVKGAFTDAVTDRVGLLDEAKGGTLFFDEVGEMSEELQVKLLRLLENGEYRRLGENSVCYADARVVSATNKNLKERVESGMFREDLYYRLATVRFEVPPLRDRKRDIEFLVRHFLTEGLASIGLGRRKVNVDMKALEAFEIYGWPGNVRELKNEIMRILSLIGDGDLIRFGMLSERIKKVFKLKNDGGILTRRVERYERRLILKALEQNDWNRSRTAEQIGIPRTTLLFKMKQLDIMA
jgi:DNA-binding NtrC family response regulator/tetratricopeptide (TPR) repeat protein